MNRLTAKEQLVLCVVVGLLLTGWAVKAYRTAHPPERTACPDPNECPAATFGEPAKP